MRRAALVILIGFLGCAAQAVRLGSGIPSGASAPGGKAQLTLADLQWSGMYRLANDSGTGNHGSPSFSSGTLAVRYVVGQRRYYQVMFQNTDSTGSSFGDLVEYKDPAQGLYSASSDPSLAPALVEVRRWSADITSPAVVGWNLHDSQSSMQDAPPTGNGTRIGGIWWDEENQVMWYQVYAFYNSTNHAIIGATQLLDTANTTLGGDYVNIGTRYGPWYYSSTTASDLHWKAIANWLVPVPADAVADIGYAMIGGGCVGSIAGAGHIGPGFHAFNLPTLPGTPNTAIALVKRLADYSRDSPTANPDAPARRNSNYTVIGWPPDHNPGSDTGLYVPANGLGYWQMQTDEVVSFAWVQTATKEGILMFGFEGTGKTAYGEDPVSSTPGYPGGPNAPLVGCGGSSGGVTYNCPPWGVPAVSNDPAYNDIADPGRSNPHTNFGYNSRSNAAQLWIFNASQVRQVGRGTRSAFNDGINPIEGGNWRTAFPLIPQNHISIDGETDASAPSITQNRAVNPFLGNTAFWDATAQQLIFFVSGSEPTEAYSPSMHVFTIKP